MKKLWGIRHIRWLYHSYGLARHLDMCRSAGIGFCAQQSDLDALQGIWEGRR